MLVTSRFLILRLMTKDESCCQRLIIGARRFASQLPSKGVPKKIMPLTRHLPLLGSTKCIRRSEYRGSRRARTSACGDQPILKFCVTTCAHLANDKTSKAMANKEYRPIWRLSPIRHEEPTRFFQTYGWLQTGHRVEQLNSSAIDRAFHTGHIQYIC